MSEVRRGLRERGPRTCALEHEEAEVAHHVEVPGLRASGQGIVLSMAHLRPQQYAATTAPWSLQGLSPLRSERP